jgi:hypothetical protein
MHIATLRGRRTFFPPPSEVDVRITAAPVLCKFRTLRRRLCARVAPILILRCHGCELWGAGVPVVLSPLNAERSFAASPNLDSIKASSTRSCRAFFLWSHSSSYSFTDGCELGSLCTSLEVLREARLDCTTMLLNEEDIISKGGCRMIFCCRRGPGTW